MLFCFSFILVPIPKDNKSPRIADTLIPNAEIIEFFTDSLNIGKKGRNKVELIKHRVFDDIYVIVKFYSKGPNIWYIQNVYLYECNSPNLDPIISDFNNDKFNDITFISATGARGANEIRRLFIYHENENELISMVNSENYPNMQYNKELDCIDAFLVYGGCSTVFLRIKNDSLKEFASVELLDRLTVKIFDERGKGKVIYVDTTNKAGYIRYKNFKPLKEYDDY
ncbi:MAG: hypothetical protein QM768_11920 [Agriterribacter sp.]